MFLKRSINEKFRHIKQSSNQLTKKILIDKVSMRLLGLNFKSDNTIKSKAIKCVVKKHCLIMNNQILHHIKTMEMNCVNCKKI